MLHYPCAGFQLFCCVIKNNLVIYGHGLYTVVHKTELETFITNKHLHCLYSNRAYVVGKILQHCRLKHRHRFLCVSEPPLGKLQSIFVVLLHKNLATLQLLQVACKTAANCFVGYFNDGAVWLIDIIFYARNTQQYTLFLKAFVAE